MQIQQRPYSVSSLCLPSLLSLPFQSLTFLLFEIYSSTFCWEKKKNQNFNSETTKLQRKYIFVLTPCRVAVMLVSFSHCWIFKLHASMGDWETDYWVISFLLEDIWKNITITGHKDKRPGQKVKRTLTVLTFHFSFVHMAKSTERDLCETWHAY